MIRLEEKCIEYYFDSKDYDRQEIIENMQNEIKKFEKKKADIEITLNDYGIYVVKLFFTKKKKEKTQKEKIYGQYKATRTYMPYIPILKNNYKNNVKYL